MKRGFYFMKQQVLILLFIDKDKFSVEHIQPYDGIAADFAG